METGRSKCKASATKRLNKVIKEMSVKVSKEANHLLLAATVIPCTASFFGLLSVPLCLVICSGV